MKYFYAILFFIVLSYAENIAEFCVTFSKDCNKYNLHLINKIVIEPDTNWIYPDSVCCGYTNCEVRWNSSFSLQSPRRTPAVVNGDWYRSPRGYLSGFHICPHCDSCEVKLQTPLLKTELDPSFRQTQIFENACRDLNKFYGKDFLGLWETNLSNTNIAYKKGFKAKIIGACEMPLLLAEYCIDDDFVLHKTKILSYLPQKHLLDSFELEINGKYEYEKNMSLDLDSLGIYNIMTYGERNICSKEHVLWGGIRLPIPNKINLKLLTDKFTRIDSFYPRNFKVKWNIEYKTSKENITDFDEYTIRVNDKCSTIPKNEEETPLDYSQHWEREIYKQDSCQVYWILQHQSK